MTTRRALLTSVSATAFALTLPTASWADDQLQVVATFSILGDMVEQIGGEHVTVTTLVGPGGDAHVFTPTPQDARSVADAEVMIMNGLEFEGWLERLVEAAEFDGTLVVATDGIEPIAYEDEHHGDGHDDHDDHDDHGDEHADHDDHDDHGDEHADHDDHDDHGDEHADHDDHDDHGDEHADHDDHDDHGDEHAEHDDHDDHAGHDHGVFDPHAWQSLTLAVTYVDNIAAALATADPDNASDYYANRAAYVAEIEALSTEVSALMAAIPENKRTIVTSHDAFGYFAEEYDLTFLAPQGLGTESEASAAEVAALITQIREEGISAVFIETLTDNRLLEQIASETGVVIGGTLHTGSLTDADGTAPTYLDMIRHNATVLSDALAE